jgi:parallel beta-helix repeat protein
MKKLSLLLILGLSWLVYVYPQPGIGTDITEEKVWGTWTTDNSPYRVYNDIRIPDDTTLIIEPGVTVIFQGHYRFIVDGTIRALATPDNIIMFTINDNTGFTNYTAPDGSWAGMEFCNYWPVEMNDNDTSILDNCRFEFAKAVIDQPQSRGDWGGAILVDNFNRLVIKNCIFYFNYASYGGAIGLNGSRFPVMKSYFTSNRAGYIGGAIMGQGTNVEIIDNQFYYSYSEGSGGAIGCWGGSDFLVMENIFAYNNAEESGGSIYLNASAVHAYNNFITNNSADNNGGGVYCNTSYPELINNVIANNDNGGIYLSSSDGLIYNNTVCYNASDHGLTFNKSNAQVINSIFYGNTTGQVYLMNELSYPDFYHCAIQGGEAGRIHGGSFEFYGAWENIIGFNPLFESHPGTVGTGFNALTADWRLKAASPLINAGTPETDLLFLPDYDIHQNPRISNRIIDIGASEKHIDVVDFSGNVTSDMTWFADTVKIHADVTIGDNVTLTINKGTVVQFLGHYEMHVMGTIKAIGTPDDMILLTCHPDSTESGWKGLSFDNTGYMNDNDTSVIQYCRFNYGKKYMGGAVSTKFFSKLVIAHSIFEFNAAGYMGGAIYCYYSNPLIYKNTIINNQAQRGGGIASDHSSPDIIDNHIVGNTASELADGLFLWFSNNYIEGNFISNHETAIHGWGGNARRFILVNNIIVQNQSGVQLSDNPCILINNTICNNVYNISYGDGELVSVNNILRNGSTRINGEYTPASFTHCNIEGGAGAISSSSLFDIETEQISDEPPSFQRVIETAGPEQETVPGDWQLLPVSPCINTGTNEMDIYSLPSHDFLGMPRINDLTVDLGAIENQGSLPEIMEQPLGGIFCSGDRHELFVHVPDTAYYRWYKDGDAIPGQTHNRITIDSLANHHEGNYSCEVSNAYGTVNSATILMIVKSPPELVSAMESGWVMKGDLFELEVIATGTPPLEFQWFQDNNPLAIGDKQKIRFQSFNYQHEGTYRCTIENACGMITTDQATLYVAPEICMVTVDTVTGNNLVVWEKRSEIAPVAQFTVYREGVIAGVFDPVAVVDYDSMSVYLDEGANPAIQSYRYKITATDTSGMESDIELCRAHKTIHLLTTTNPETRATQLDWDFYYGFNYGTFNIYRSGTGTNFSTFYQMASSSTTYTDPNPDQKVYYYRIGVVKPDPCVPSSTLKADAGPYSHSMSNVEDNRLQSTGLKELAENEGINIYPNPFSDHTTIRFANPGNKAYQLVIRDLSGKVVRSVETIQTGEFMLYKGNLRPGYYFVELKGDRIYRGKLVIE